MSDPTVKTVILILLEILLLLYLGYLLKRIFSAIKTGQIRDYVNRLLASSGGYMISSDGIGKFPAVERNKTPAQFYINLFLILAMCALVIAVGVWLPNLSQRL